MSCAWSVSVAAVTSVLATCWTQFRMASSFACSFAARASPATAAWPTASVVFTSSPRAEEASAARARATAKGRFMMVSLVGEDDDLRLGEEREVLAGEGCRVGTGDDEVRALCADGLHDDRLVPDPILQVRLRRLEVLRVRGGAAGLAPGLAERGRPVDLLARLVADARRERGNHLLPARVDDERGAGRRQLRLRGLRLGLRLRLREERVREGALERHLHVHLHAAVGEVARGAHDLEPAHEPVDAAGERGVRLERAADGLARLELHALERLHAVAERVELRRLLRPDARDGGIAGGVAEVRRAVAGALHDLPLPVHAALGADGHGDGARQRRGEGNGSHWGSLRDGRKFYHRMSTRMRRDGARLL